MEVNCSLFQEMIFPYLDNNLTDEATACFLEHARTCPECQDALEEARSFEFGLIGTFTAMEPPVDLADNIMASLHAEGTLFAANAAEVAAAAVAVDAVDEIAEATETPVTETQVTEEKTEEKGKVVKFPKKGVFAAVGTVAAAAVLALAVGVSGAGDDSEIIDLQVADKDKDQSISDTIDWQTEELDESLTIGDIMKDQQGKDNVSDWGAFGDDKNTVVNRPSYNTGNGNMAVEPEKKPDTKPVTKPDNKPVTKPENKPVTKPDNNGEVTTPIVLPDAAFGTETTGDMEQRLVAAYEENDICMPSISLDNQVVTYYTKINDQIYIWESSLVNPEQPVSKGAVTDKDFVLKNTTQIYDVNTVIHAPDMSMMAMNARGKESGIWLSFLTGNQGLIELCKEGGGDILAWAPNSSKFVFTDAEGKLYIAYPIEKRIVLAYENGQVKDVAWGSDNTTLVFTAVCNNDKAEGEDDKCQMSLFTIQIP